MCGKKDSSIRELTKKKEKILASFSVAPETVKVTALAPDKMLTKLEKSLNNWVEDINRNG